MYFNTPCVMYCCAYKRKLIILQLLHLPKNSHVKSFSKSVTKTENNFCDFAAKKLSGG